MTKLVISLSKKRATRLAKHLAIEHPMTKGKIKLMNKRRRRSKK